MIKMNNAMDFLEKKNNFTKTNRKSTNRLQLYINNKLWNLKVLLNRPHGKKILKPKVENYRFLS